MEKFKKFFKDERGSAAVEYGMLLGLISVVVALGMTDLGSEIKNFFDNTAAYIATLTATIPTP